MIKSLLTLGLGWLALAFAPMLVSQAAPADAEVPATSEPILLELFTSQGCSSCPPADRFAAELARDPSLVVISRPVTYWDRLGWRDTLAREANTDLQRAYSRRGLEGRNGVYTPQIVSNGEFGAVGSRKTDVRSQIAAALGSGNAAIRIRSASGGGYGVGLGGTTQRVAELVLVAVSSHEEVEIARGENGGRAIGYTNVVLDERVIAEWSGGKASHRIGLAQLFSPQADRHALVLRIPNGGPVLAALWLSARRPA